MEVRVRVTDLDWTTGMEIHGKPVPVLKTREVDTGVELGAGQTLLIRGLVQNRTKGAGWEASTAGTTGEAQEEVELLILMTPELLDPMRPGDTLGLPKPVSAPVPVPSTAPRPGTVAPPPKPAASRPRPYLSGYVSPAVPRPSTAPAPPEKPTGAPSRYGSNYVSPPVPRLSTAPRPSTAPAPADKPLPPPTPYGPADRYGAPVNSSSAAQNAP